MRLTASTCVQVAVALLTATQPAASLPSETATVTVAAPAEVHVKVGLAAVAPDSDPAVAVHEYVSAALFGPRAWASSAIVPPTSTLAGLASMPSITGQSLVVALTTIVPLSGVGPEHASATGTDVV